MPLLTIQSWVRAPGVLLAFAAACAAGWMYARTLLPGLDFGDTASFQTIVTLPLVTPRHGYPLYYALGKLWLHLFGGEPAFAMNVASAVTGAFAIGVFAYLAFELTRSQAAALWSALLFAGSYTFWSQAVIAEVYTLQALLIGLTWLAALRWWRVPSGSRLVVLYSVYAISFGAHLSMVLFAPALVWLLWHGRGRASLDPFSARGLAIAAALASLGAAQFAWNFHALWALSAPRRHPLELLATFWFDVTKTDWRETLVGTVPLQQRSDRVAMYWWDLKQQFGLAGVALAAAGGVALVGAARTLAVALLLAYAATFTFAFLYNVGDVHVFLLPSHQIVALFAACGTAALVRLAGGLRGPYGRAALALLFVVPLWRIGDTWAAVDRSGDVRAGRFAAAALTGMDAGNAVYVGDMNWQTLNAVSYERTVHRPELPSLHSSGVLWRFPEFVRRNHDLGRDIVLTVAAAESIRATYGAAFRIEADTRQPVSTVAAASSAAAGTPYVLAVLTPLRGMAFDSARVGDAARHLSREPLPSGRYAVLAGVAGSPPVLRIASDRPFRAAARLPVGRVEIRIEAWLPTDTMRRAGFGHVIVNGRHRFTIERGASYVAFDRRGEVVVTAYEGGTFSLQPRYRIPVLR